MKSNQITPRPWESIEELCDTYLGARPSAFALAQLKKVEGQRPEALAFTERAFRLMNISHFRATDITPVVAWGIGVTLDGLLPGAWGGSIPPFTWENRHRRINEWLASNPWTALSDGTVMLEMGCGFPPLTAIDAAAAFPGWKIVGTDPCFDEYLLYDEKGNYACMDGNGAVRYFHAGSANPADLFALYNNYQATVEHFRELFQGLLPLVPVTETPAGEPVSVSNNAGARLVRNPVHLFERPNLRLIQAGIGEELPQADIIRCFNVLIYFDDAFRARAEAWALATLRPGGLFLCGVDSGNTTDARYSVYRSEDGRLSLKEFAFSMDNIRPFDITAWFTMHDGEREAWTLAEYVGALRSDGAFLEAYDRRLDELLAEKRLLVRDPDGFLADAPDPLPRAEWTAAKREIDAQLGREGFADRAVEALRKAGMDASLNSVGHIAIRSTDT